MLLASTFITFPTTAFCQTINLGILESFEGYTGAGAVTNGAGATWTGDAGTNMGIISGFGAPPNFNGNTYNGNAETAQCKIDLMKLYIHLNELFVNNQDTHAPAFGGGETLSPGVYSTSGAGSIGGVITLDGGGDSNSFFIIKFSGALTVGAGTAVTLTGATQSCNVFYMADGAISVAANANIKGSLFSRVGAISLGVGTVLEGRMLTMDGAITAGANAIVSPPSCTSSIPIFCENNCSAAIDILGVLSNYALYTNLGAVANTGLSGIIGNIGTDSGSISGYGASIVIGAFYTSDPNTAQANIDLENAYISLMNLPNTVPSDAGVLPVVTLAHTPNYGSVATGGETINAGVYFVNGAGSLSGTLVLDGQNNPNAIFVFKFAGALSVAAQSKMILINDAKRCNIFWIAGAGIPTGAISIGANSVLKGTFLAHGGACGSGASVFLAGRQLSTGGAVNTYSGMIYNNPICVTSTAITNPLPIELLSFTGECYNQSTVLKWSTSSEINNAYFSIERSQNGIDWQLVTTVDGQGNSSSQNNYSVIVSGLSDGISYYRIKQTDFDGKIKYHTIIALENCGDHKTELVIFPNPASGILNISYRGDKSEITSVSIYNIRGEMVYESVSYQSKIVFENNLNGIYFLHVNTTSKIHIKEFVAID